MHIIHDAAYLLDDNPHSPFAPSPPSISRSLFMSEPTLSSEVVSKFLNAITDPFTFANIRWHPLRVVEDSYQSEQRHNSRQLMEKKEGTDVSQRRVDQRRCVLSKKSRKTRCYTLDPGLSGLRCPGFQFLGITGVQTSPGDESKLASDAREWGAR